MSDSPEQKIDRQKKILVIIMVLLGVVMIILLVAGIVSIINSPQHKITLEGDSATNSEMVAEGKKEDKKSEEVKEDSVGSAGSVNVVGSASVAGQSEVPQTGPNESYLLGAVLMGASVFLAMRLVFQKSGCQN